ncbi:hypothetical protein, partial [Paenibacillus ihuae]|uniref:hypothetical protein n=1 Tax=Paenibacillus ihuae TaxID=1232431 RepID=UPI001AE0D8C8
MNSSLYLCHDFFWKSAINSAAALNNPISTKEILYAVILDGLLVAGSNLSDIWYNIPLSVTPIP